MAKSKLEKQIEQQMKQAKQLADKQRKEEQKRARERVRMERKEIVRDRASSIVNGQPIVEGVRIIDKTAEEVLSCLLGCNRNDENKVGFDDEIFPDYVQLSIDVELEKLVQYGMIGGLITYDNGGWLNLLPPALSYFKDKEEALKKQKHQEEIKFQNIVNYGNIVFGDVSDSTLSVDNSIHEIEKAIDQYGGEDKVELHGLLDEVKELLVNIQISRSVPKQKNLYQKLSDHMEKWLVLWCCCTIARNCYINNARCVIRKDVRLFIKY